MTTPTTNPGRDLRPGLVKDALGLDTLLAATKRPARDAIAGGL